MTILRNVQTTGGKIIPYVAVVTYRDYTGKRRQVRKNAEKRREAEALEREFLNRRDLGELTGMKPPPVPVADTTETVLTVRAYLESWLARRRNIRETTLTRYRHALAPVWDRVGASALTDLTPTTIESVYDSLRTAGRAEKTILNVHRVLKDALSDAVQRDILARNPADRVEAPRAPAAEIRVLSRGELDRIVAAADETTIGPIVRLAAFTGLRLGEMLGLKWTDIEGDRLTVRRMLNNAGKIDEPKSRRSRRTITLSEGTVAMLRDVLAAQLVDKMQTSNYRDDGYVFADELGGFLPQFHVAHIWRGIVKKAGVDRARIHDLRHAHASHLLSDGWSLADVAERLGHSRTSITLDFYSHSLPGRDADLAKSIDRLFGSPQ